MFSAAGVRDRAQGGAEQRDESRPPSGGASGGQHTMDREQSRHNTRLVAKEYRVINTFDSKLLFCGVEFVRDAFRGDTIDTARAT